MPGGVWEALSGASAHSGTRRSLRAAPQLPDPSARVRSDPGRVFPYVPCICCCFWSVTLLQLSPVSTLFCLPSTLLTKSSNLSIFTLAFNKVTI